MGKITGFLEFEREEAKVVEPEIRIQNFNEFHKRLPIKQQQMQGARCMDCGVPFCQYGQILNGMTSGCPLHNLIPEWNDLIFKGNYKQALSRLLKTNNFPEFTGRVCPHPCEYACTCSLNGDGVSIHENELSIIEYAYENGDIIPQKPTVRTGKKVAVIGSGPAGLAVADQLNKRGHEVTVYEKEDRLGGLLMYGIPNMKLDKRVIDRRIALMKAEGIQFIVNTPIETSKQAERLKTQFDSIVLACGAPKPRDLNVEGRSGKGIYFAVDYLKEVTRSLLDSQLKKESFPNTKDKNVLVIGGGDTGNDCVATAIRLGCKSVTQLEITSKPSEYRLKNNPWPQWPKVLKTDYGQLESIAVFGKDPRLFDTTVKSFMVNEQGQVTGAKIVQLETVYNKKTGKIERTEKKQSEKIIDCDLVLIAAGFIGCDEHLAKAFDIELTEKNVIKTLDNSYKTSQDKIFVAGDMHRGASLVVWAIKEGREASKAVDEYLMGYSNL